MFELMLELLLRLRRLRTDGPHDGAELALGRVRHQAQLAHALDHPVDVRRGGAGLHDDDHVHLNPYL